MKVYLQPGVIVRKVGTKELGAGATFGEIVRYDRNGFYVLRHPKGEYTVHEDDIEVVNGDAS